MKMCEPLLISTLQVSWNCAYIDENEYRLPEDTPIISFTFTTPATVD